MSFVRSDTINVAILQTSRPGPQALACTTLNLLRSSLYHSNHSSDHDPGLQDLRWYLVPLEKSHRLRATHNRANSPRSQPSSRHGLDNSCVEPVVFATTNKIARIIRDDDSRTSHEWIRSRLNLDGPTATAINTANEVNQVFALVSDPT